MGSSEQYLYNELKANAKLLRRDMRRIGQMLRYSRYTLDGVPVLFANSFPKSGTHLLTQILQGFTKIGPAINSGLPAFVTFDGTTGKRRKSDQILKDINRLKPGDIAYGHLHAIDVVTTALCSNGMATYFIFRDPRDVVVSHVYYVTEIESNHVHHRYYKDELVDFDQRLRTSILGRPDFDDLFPNIRERFEPYLGWLDQPQVNILKFEDFILDQERVIKQVLDHAVERGFPVEVSYQQAIQSLSAEINPKKSPTFRRGKVGDWQTKFSPLNRDLFKQVAGDLLIQLGYESTHDW